MLASSTSLLNYDENLNFVIILILFFVKISRNTGTVNNF